MRSPAVQPCAAVPEETAPQGYLPVQVGPPAPAEALPEGDAGAVVVRRKWVEQKYQVSGTDRSLHVEENPPVWGDAHEPPWKPNKARPRAILFETMGTPAKVRPLLQRLRDLRAAAAQDVGLSVVVNGAWVPPDQYTDKGDKTKAKTPVPKEPPAQPTDPVALKKFLTEERTKLVNGWDGPPLDITTAAWERRSRADAEGAMETVQSSVPYTSLRALAASNDGALVLGEALAGSHETLWHKMGDDDMPIINPNPEEDEKAEKDADEYEHPVFDIEPADELSGLRRVEESGVDHSTTIVTFGYNLTTDFLPKTQTPVSPGISTALQALYRIEMELRNKIRDLGAPIYPSEPTSFYRTIKGNNAADVWRAVPNTKAGGGSGQQLEGAKLLVALTGSGESKNVSTNTTKSEKSGPEKKTASKARNESPQKVVGKEEKSVKGFTAKSGSGGMQREAKNASGFIQHAFHTVQVDTSAGGRNDKLVALLEGWRIGADTTAVKEDLVIAEINKLDQCALKHGEYLDKVFAKIPTPNKMSDSIVGMIAKLVESERVRAATAVCDAIRAEILNPVPQQGPLQQGAQQQGPQQQVPVQQNPQPVQQGGQPMARQQTRTQKSKQGQGGSRGTGRGKKVD
jgi:hypothetical protein